MLPTTLEWHAIAGVVALSAFMWPILGLGAIAMLLLSLTVAGAQAFQAKLPKHHNGLISRLVVLVYSYLQPLVRSYHRYRTRLFYFQPAASAPWVTATTSVKFPVSGRQTADYWSETSSERLVMLEHAVEFLSRHRWGRIVDSGWTDWDLRIYCHPLVYLQVRTTQENHGGNKRLIRVNQKLRLRDFARLLFGGATIAILLASTTWPAFAAGALAIGAVVGAVLWWRCIRLAGQTSALFRHIADQMGMIECGPGQKVEKEAIGPVEIGTNSEGDTLVERLA
jgi:hypothetical protein